jgi:Domain of unknown function (DUF3482)
LAMTGAASGALAGGLVDAATGGASLLLGAAIGAAIGAASTVMGASRLAQVEVLGQPLGGYELRVGPLADPNLPWVLLGRAVLHARLVAERNHARRGELVVEAGGAEQVGSRLGPGERRRFDALFRRLKSDDDAHVRTELAEAVVGLLDEPAQHPPTSMSPARSK